MKNIKVDINHNKNAATHFSLNYKPGNEETAIRYIDFLAMSRHDRKLISDEEKQWMMQEARNQTGVELAFLEPDPEFDWMNVDMGQKIELALSMHTPVRTPCDYS